MPTPWKDRALALAIGAAAFALYVRTLAPGLVPIMDTPMFQFLGRVLGVAHNPGYPFYSLVTYPFSFVPIGTLAYRINLFSALCGGLTVALAYMITRRLQTGRIAALVAAAGLAVGTVFWSQATIAEVYTLHAALVAGILLALLTWEATRNARYFYLAIVLFAAGLGNHTTIVGFAPAIALFAIAVDPGFVRRARTLFAVVAILLAGLCQYGFILLRTSQGAYAESPATDFLALVDVVRGHQFANRLFVFDWRTVLTDRLPFLISHVLVPEFTLAGLGLAAVGAAWLVARRWRDSLLLLAGGAAIFVFALNYDVVDIHVVLIPVFLVLWIAAGAGLHALMMETGRRARIAGAVLAMVFAALPVWMLVTHFPVNDQSREVDAATALDQLFDVLPDRSAIVREDFIVDRMVSYELLGRGLARARTLTILPEERPRLLEFLDQGFQEFAFDRSAARLRAGGFDVSYEPFGAARVPLVEFVATRPRGTLIALAIPGAEAAAFDATERGIFALVGAPTDIFRGRIQSNLALAGERDRGAAIWRVDPKGVDLRASELAGAEAPSWSVPDGLELAASGIRATVRRAARDLVATGQGLAVAVWTPDRARVDTFVAERDGSGRFAVTLPRTALSAYRVRGLAPTVSLSPASADLRDIFSSGNVLIGASPGAVVTVELHGTERLRPRVLRQSAPSITVAVEGCDEDACAAAPVDAQGARVTRLRISMPANLHESGSLELCVGAVPSAATAAVTGDAARASVQRLDTQGLLDRLDRGTERLVMSRGEQASLVADGWSGVEFDSVTPFRWIEGVPARLMLPVTLAAPFSIALQAFSGDDAQTSRRTVQLVLNGVALPAQAVLPNWHEYSWTPPVGALHRGPNAVSVVVADPEHPTRRGAGIVAVTSVTVSAR
jgi:hypothetical protein